MKINFLKKQKKLKKENFRINANFYWEVILSVTLILIIGSFIFGFYFFMKTDKEFIPPIDNGTNSNIIQKQKIDKTLEYFSIREQKSKDILNSTSSVVDPAF